MKISKQVKVGLLATISLVILYLGFNFLKGVDFFSPNIRYYVIYDNINGLTVSNPVLLNGLAVGQVREIRILQTQNNRLLVTLDINEEVIVRDSTVAILTDSDLLGGKSVVLQMNAAKPRMEKNDTLIGATAEGLTNVIREKTLPVIDILDSTLVNVNRLVKEFAGAGNKINGTLTKLEQTSIALEATLRENRANLNKVTTNLGAVSASMNDSQTGVQPILRKVNTFADSLIAMQLNQTVANANQSMAELRKTLDQINQGKGTLGKLVVNDSLYTNLNRAVADLDSLFVDVKRNPRRYINVSVFGGGGKKNR